MAIGIIVLIVLCSIIGLFVFVYLIGEGLSLCFKNNTYGVLLLFIALNIFGLIIGCCIISNTRTLIKQEEFKEKKILYDKFDKFLDKKEKNKNPQSN